MAYTTDSRTTGATLAQRFAGFRATLADRAARRRVYKTTVNELSALSRRDLNDLGIDQSSIRSIAYEAAYGQ